MRSPRRRTAGIALGAVLVALFAIVAVAQGFGHPSPSGDEIAVVEDAADGSDVAVTQEEFDAALERTAIRQGLEEPPAPDDPQYELIRDSTIADLLLAVWVRGESETRGIEAPESEVDDQIEQIKEQEFNGNDNRFNNFLEESGLTEEAAREQLELQILSSEIQADALSEEPEIDEAEIEAFYEENPDQFEQPESRDVRVVQAENRADAQAAVDALGDDPSQQDWSQVVNEYSTGQQGQGQGQGQGGLREGLTPGQSEQALDEQVFGAPTGEVIGPFEGEAGFYVIEVEQVNPSRTVPLEEATEQIRGSLQSARQQQVAQDFQRDFLTTWTSRTYCAPDYRIDRCANADPVATACTEDVAEEQGCPAPVPSTQPLPAGTAGSSPDPTGGPAGRPQGPCAWIDPADEEMAQSSCQTWNVKPAPPPSEQPGELPPGIQEQLPEGAPPPQGQAPPPPGQGQPGGQQPPPPPQE